MAAVVVMSEAATSVPMTKFLIFIIPFWFLVREVGRTGKARRGPGRGGVPHQPGEEAPPCSMQALEHERIARAPQVAHDEHRQDALGGHDRQVRREERGGRDGEALAREGERERREERRDQHPGEPRDERRGVVPQDGRVGAPGDRAVERARQERPRAHRERVHAERGEAAEHEEDGLKQERHEDHRIGGPAEDDPHEAVQYQVGARETHRHVDQGGDEERRPHEPR